MPPELGHSLLERADGLAKCRQLDGGIHDLALFHDRAL
jgi:hypothetical protein